MAKLVNNTNIPLSMAVWLASNSYDFKPNAKSLSATDFNRSIRQTILKRRVSLEENDLNKEDVDIVSIVKSRTGTAVHDAIERVWADDELRSNALKNLGYPQSIIDRIKINPDKVEGNDIPVYMEIRDSIEVDGYTISGKFDFVAEGKLTDFKTTGTWKWGKLAEADKDYRTQGSIYKLIHSKLITEDVLDIVFLFSDWSPAKAKGNKDYPEQPCVVHKVKLLSNEQTLQFIKHYISQLEKYADTPEPELPKCNADHLWQDKPSYKYYKNPMKTQRATKVFDNIIDAKKYEREMGIGLVQEVQAEARACKYCSAYKICTQKDELIAQGILKT